ncbi:hypothetical protein DERP_000285 [Dermatophagoides pteronyssinus]|uniref:Uncharacterized protein n=1 Tax=Dermatophagoides pteronyssinus TaxID=6956 RepID=A0ABQ8IZR0_DERPT|nr:hypothetical protein DERP_000285 [Dermatophagoides pteronyssinus]
MMAVSRYSLLFCCTEKNEETAIAYGHIWTIQTINVVQNQRQRCRHTVLMLSAGQQTTNENVNSAVVENVNGHEFSLVRRETTVLLAIGPFL